MWASGLPSARKPCLDRLQSTSIGSATGSPWVQHPQRVSSSSSRSTALSQKELRPSALSTSMPCLRKCISMAPTLDSTKAESQTMPGTPLTEQSFKSKWTLLSVSVEWLLKSWLILTLRRRLTTLTVKTQKKWTFSREKRSLKNCLKSFNNAVKRKVCC